jgi:predicted nuclease with TOPRIM domain
MKESSHIKGRTNLSVQLGHIVIEIHNMARAVKNLEGKPTGLAESLRRLGDSVSDLNALIYKIDSAVELPKSSVKPPAS